MRWVIVVKKKLKLLGMLVENCKVRYDYNIEDIIEVGIVLRGIEIKFICCGSVNLKDSFV